MRPVEEAVVGVAAVVAEEVGVTAPVDATGSTTGVTGAGAGRTGEFDLVLEPPKHMA